MPRVIPRCVMHTPSAIVALTGRIDRCGMRLTPTELDRVLIFNVAEMARRRRDRGLKLNHPEAVALISDELMELARGGATFQEVIESGPKILSVDDVLDGVPDLVGSIRLECVFDDGPRLVVVDNPLR